MKQTGTPPLVVELPRGEETHLAIRLAPGGSNAHKILGTPRSKPGYVLTKSQLHTWYWKGIEELQGWLYLTFQASSGPAGDILRPIEDIFTHSPGMAIRGMKTYIQELSRLQTEFDFEISGHQLNGSFYDEDLGLYFLHPRICEVMDLQTGGEYLPPGLSDEKELTYRLFRSLYTCFLRSGSDSTPSPELGKHPEIIHPNQQLRNLRTDIADDFFRILVNENIPDFEESIHMLERWESELLFDEILSPVDDGRVLRAQHIQRNAKRKAAFRRFRRKYGTAVLLTCAGFLILGLFFWPVLQRRLEPDVTVGLSQSEVVRLFYESLNSLSHEIMQECVTKNAGDSHINQVTTLFVISKVRQGIEMKDFFLSAPEWVSQGRPPLTNGLFVFGITDLSIRATTDDDILQATYVRWTTLPSKASEDLTREERSNIEALQSVQAFIIVEELHLTETKQGWKIDLIEELLSTPKLMDLKQK